VKIGVETVQYVRAIVKFVGELAISDARFLTQICFGFLNAYVEDLRYEACKNQQTKYRCPEIHSSVIDG
jgi:hypothetical protein